MQSSRDTTKFPTGEELYAALNRKLKKTSGSITQRKLDTGEYVMHQGRIVPVTVIEEAKAEAVVKRGIISRPKVNLADFEQHAELWLGSRKSIAATTVQRLTRQPIRVIAAAALQQGVSRSTPKDGQLFSYDAKSGRMLPVDNETLGGISDRSKPRKKNTRILGMKSR